MANKNKELAQGKIKDGWIHFDKYFKGSLVEFCKAREGMRIWITIIAGNARSLAQNAFFHGPLINAFVRATGDTDVAGWKGRLKEMFLRIPDGKGGLYTQGTADLSIDEFREFIDKCVGVLQDQHHGYLDEYEHKEYVGTLGKKDIDFYTDNKDQMKMVDTKTGEVLKDKIPW